MPGPTHWMDELNKIPAWLKAAIGLLGTIAGFIIALRNNWRLYTTIAVFLTLAYLLGISLYVLLKRRALRSKKGQYIFLYARYRPWGFLGLALGFLAFTGLLAAKPSRQIALEGILGTFTPVPPPQLQAPDVLIAPFDAPATSEHKVEHWLQESLQQQLALFGLDNVTVHMGEKPIRSETEAQDVANSTGGKVIIWGWYDDLGIQVKLFLSGGKESGRLVDGTGVIPLGSGGVPASDVSVIITEVLPQNVTFLSLFVVGHLEYLSDNYQAGHRAFDAAMALMPAPEKVNIQNQAILQFFQARQMDRDSTDPNAVICEYTQAIELDPTFDVAYNNLGLVISRMLAKQNYPSPEASACLKQVGVEVDIRDLPAVLFERATVINPKLTIAKYNDLAYKWLNSEADNEEIQPEMENIQKQDPGLIGTYILLGVIKEEDGDPAGAIQMYESGIAVEPDIALLHVNLGQLYLSFEKDPSKAEAQFLEAVRLSAADAPARLALGNLYYRQGRLDEAASQLDALFPAVETDRAHRYPSDALVLRSTIAFAGDRSADALEYASRAIQFGSKDAYLYLLLGLLQQHEGQLEKAAPTLRQVVKLDPSFRSPSLALFREKCFTAETYTMDFADWSSNQLPASTCLPADPKERLLAVYDLRNDDLFALRENPEMLYLGAQCPYVYTEDPITGEWKFQTTILYKLVDHEGAQMRPLTQFNGKLLIREEEPEISHLNQLYVLAEMADGSTRILEPDVDALRHADSEYIVLQQGDELLVTLGHDAASGAVRRWWVMASGYYTPLR